MSVYPTAQQRAGHIPADTIPPGVDPRTVVIVHAAPRSYAGPLIVVLSGTLGAALVVWLLIVLVNTIAHEADALAKVAGAVGGVGVGGVTLKIAKGVK